MRPNSWSLRLSLAVTVIALAVAAACGGGSSSSPTPAPATPTPTQLIVTPGPTASPPQTDYRLVFRESTATEDVIWSVSPADPTQREELARVQHADGYPIVAAMSPDATMLAYLSLPDGSAPDSSTAEAYVIDLQSEDKTPVKIADGIDYQTPPVWSPDGGLLYMRRYAGPEFLAANVSLVRVRVTPSSSTTPTPTPSPPPGVAPWPGIDPVETVMQDTVAHVLSWTPLGFADDSKSMFFLQEEGGTGGGTLVGIFAPATTAEVEKLHQAAEDAWYAAQDANQQAINDAAGNGQPPPIDTVTPAPTPSPDSRFVVQLSAQRISAASLSPDSHSVAYLNQSIADSGDILNQTWVADLIQATTAALPLQGLPAGDQLNPVWFPDGRLTVSVLPAEGGPGVLAIVATDLSSVTFLAQPESGYDVPRAWAPDGTWLAVSHQGGTSVANPGIGELDIISVSGQRLTVADGSANSGEGSVLGWFKPVEATPTP